MKRMVRVLIADDDELMQTILSALVTSLGGTQLVGLAADGEEAVNKFRDLRPDVVLLDLNMPKLSGLESLKKIKALEPSARVVMLTASSAVDVVKECIASGASNYLLKANSPDKIRAALKDIFFEQLKQIVG